MRDFRKISIEDILVIYWRRRWWVVLCTVLVGALGLLYAWSLPPMYRSATTILIESQFVPEDYVRSTVRDTTDERINSINQQLHSRSFLGRIIQDLRLYGFGRDQEFVMEVAVERLRKQMEITWLRNTFVLSYYSTEPQQARDVTRRLATDLIEINSRTRKNQAIETDSFIVAELRQCAAELANYEEKIKNFKITHQGELPDQVTDNLESLNRLQVRLGNTETALQKAREQRSTLERLAEAQSRLTILQPMVRNTAPADAEAKPAIDESFGLRAKLDAKTKLLSETRARYTEKHPQVVQLTREVLEMERQLREAEGQKRPDNVAPAPPREKNPETEQTASVGTAGPSDFDITSAELKVELEGIKGEINSLQKERESIQAQIRVYEVRRVGAPRAEQELLALTREYEALRQQYKELQQKRFDAQVAANLEKSTKNETLKIIDEAYLPARPVGPNRPKIALMGVAAGMLLGLGLVLGLEYINSAITDESQASQELGLSILISIPEITTKDLESRRARKIRSAERVLPISGGRH